MEFIKALLESEDSKKFSGNTRYRGFKHIEKGDVSLSIQASYGHYCNPRLTLNDLNDYSRMEFALIRNDEFIQVKDIIPNHSLLDEIEEYFDGSVYGYVPVKMIEQLYKSYFV